MPAMLPRLSLACLFAFCPLGYAQMQPAIAPVASTSETLTPALARVSQAVQALNIGKWKVSGQQKSLSQKDAQSVSRDLDQALPGLMQQATAQPASVAAAFAVYRNVDALYDVLLRLAKTAENGAPQSEAASLQFALERLETARTQLGQAIQAVAADHDTALTKLVTAAQAQAAQSARPATTVVEDGPKPAARHKRKTAAAKTALPQPQ